MAPFAVSRALRIAAGVLTLAMLCVSPSSFSQLADDAAAARVQQQIVERIEREQSVNGTQSNGLIDPLTELSLFYQEQGDFGLAAAAIDRARQIVRVNYGLKSLVEAPLMQMAIRNEESMGNADGAWRLEEELLSLVWPDHNLQGSEQYPNDMRVVPILSEIADKRIDILERYRSGEFPPQIVLGCYYDKPNEQNCGSGSQTWMTNAIQFEARWYRAAAIKTILINEDYESTELRELEASSLRFGRGWSVCPDVTVEALLEAELLGSCLDPIIIQRKTSLANVGGEATLMRSLIYEVRSGASVLRQVNALIQLADWKVRLPFVRSCCGRRYGSSALELYEYANRQLKNNAISQDTIDKLLSPAIPIVLQTFYADTLTFEDGGDSIGYIDVAFDVTKYGRGEKIEILGATADVSREDERVLVRLIERSAFRPRLTNGQFADISRVATRYFPSD